LLQGVEQSTINFLKNKEYDIRGKILKEKHNMLMKKEIKINNKYKFNPNHAKERRKMHVVLPYRPTH
jgi:hypothetical protein